MNCDVFQVDPTTTTIPNDGVAQVREPSTPEEWEVLRYELERFVCEGAYADGLERVLSTYVDTFGQPRQPAVWVSGFYGSGKSHLVRVLEYLWRDVEFPDGARARGLARLPQEIQNRLRELSTLGRREGGLWSAAGNLSSSAGKSVRLSLLSIVFQSAGLPAKYPLACFELWLRENEWYEAVKDALQRQGRDFTRELPSLHVSPAIAQALVDGGPKFSNIAEARDAIRRQFNNVEDISDDELVDALGRVLTLKSTADGKWPCTVLVFDELQQFIGEDPGRTLQVQDVVEACTARFRSHLLFVGTGQAQLQATPSLQKLQGRFTVRVMLSDTDVEHVVREVVLRKRPEKLPELEDVLRAASGEIDRQLAGTKIGPRGADRADLAPDYPLLPVRRRFWESVLRSVDVAGSAGQLRTQLRIVHDATRDVARDALGTVIAGDYIFDQLKPDMLQSGVLLRDTATMIAEQEQNGPDGQLRARLCATIFLVGKLATEGPAAPSVRATADALADLLVQDLPAGSAALRQSIPKVLADLVDAGMLMLVDGEYRLQTREGQEWEQDFRARHARIKADDTRIASDRNTALHTAVTGALKGISLVQGVTKTPRRYETYFGAEMPSTATAAVPVWVRDEWSVSEKGVREDAQAAGVASPVVFVFLPKLDGDTLRERLANQAAAVECLSARPPATTPEGTEARLAMESRLRIEQAQVAMLIGTILRGARIFQGGGNELSEGSLQASVRAALDASLSRLFPRFDIADVAGWGTVVRRVQQGSTDPLGAVGYEGEVESQPVCREVRDFVGGAGKRGTEVRKRFQGEPYGWPQDAIDGALLTLVVAGLVRVSKNGQPVSAKQLDQREIGVADFAGEGVVITAKQRIDLRAFFGELGLNCKTGEEAEASVRVLDRLLGLSRAAGGEAPLPERPSTGTIEDLLALAGNEQLAAVWQRRDELQADNAAWTRAQTLIAERQPRWATLQRLLTHAAGLPVATEVTPQVVAIRTQRSLLAEPDPVAPLLRTLATAMRNALQEQRRKLVEAQQRELSGLQATEEWLRIPGDARQRILRENSLGPVPELKVGTDEDLLKELDAAPLADWNEKALALPGRVAKAREEAVKLLTPQAVRVSVPSATLKTPQEVDTYLATLREAILAHVNAGKPVIL
jgi:hypothetical protein